MLPESVHARLLALSRAARGEEMPVFSFYGATEYLFGMVKYWPGGRTDVIGLPPPEAQLKLKPIGDRYELFVRTPTIMPRSGYLDAPEATASVFDEEDYFRTGDAVAFADPADPTQGLVFAGRIADDFKLSSGTFVGANALRQDLLTACAPLLKEVVLSGLNQEWVGALVWLDEKAASPGVTEQLVEKLAAFNAQAGGSSRRVGTVAIMTEPLSFDAGELTDKGNVSPNMVRARRASAVASLFATPSPPGVLRFVKGKP
jgi:feruloyl-CoA synthase